MSRCFSKRSTDYALKGQKNPGAIFAQGLYRELKDSIKVYLPIAGNYFDVIVSPWEFMFGHFSSNDEPWFKGSNNLKVEAFKDILVSAQDRLIINCNREEMS